MSMQIDTYNNHFTLKMLLINNINVVINWLLNAAKFSPTQNDGTPVKRFVVIKSWYDVYATIGVGKTESVSTDYNCIISQAAKVDCVVQITQLMKKNFGIDSYLDSYTFLTNTKCFSDLQYAIYVVENSSMFSKEQTEKLGVLGYFLDTGNTKSPLEMLCDISNIMITRLRETATIKSGVHVYKHYINFYCSTGLGLTVEDAKKKSAEQMICTLQKLCGFVPEIKLSPMDNPVNDRNEHRVWLYLPMDDQYKIKMIRYFMETNGNVPHAVQLNEIASIMKVVVKYSDSGNEENSSVACEFGPHIAVGHGSSKMVNVFRARTAMLNKLRLVCGYEQYPRTFVPLDCLDSAVGENRRKDRGYGRHNYSVPSFPVEYQTYEVGIVDVQVEPLERRDTTMWNCDANTTSIRFANAQESTEVVVRDGVTVRGTFKPFSGRNLSRRYSRRRSVRCFARFTNKEELSVNPNREDTN